MSRNMKAARRLTDFKAEETSRTFSDRLLFLTWMVRLLWMLYRRVAAEIWRFDL